jgi:predicted ATP-grasp superfamily ATP-dependent carboligase
MGEREVKATALPGPATADISEGAALPPVFVMNTYYTGIGIARNLHGYGVDVYGLSSEADAPGVRSRFFKGIYWVPNGRDEPEALCERLIELRKRHDDAPVIFPTRDFDVMFLQKHRRELSSLYRLPQNSAVESLLDKLALFNIAKTHDIPVPTTVVCRSIEDVAAQSATLRFPLVVKPRIAASWRHKGAWEAVGARKAFLVTNAEELFKEYALIASVSPELMIQEYVEGSDCDIAVCCCFIDMNHEMAAYFTARKLRQNPPLFGTGCAVETTMIPEIVPIAKRLLQAVGYTGIAEVEFKRDSSAGRWFLIEVNPRHWDQHEIGTHVGVNLSWIAYLQMIGRPSTAVAMRQPTGEFKWIAEIEALRLILQNAYSQIQENRGSPSPFRKRLGQYCQVVRTTLQELAFLLKGQKVFAVLHRGDPLPGILLCLRTARELCDTLTRHVTSHLRTRHAEVD